MQQRPLLALSLQIELRSVRVQLRDFGGAKALVRHVHELLVDDSQPVAQLNLPIEAKNAEPRRHHLARQFALCLLDFELRQINIHARDILLAGDPPGDRKLLADADPRRVLAIIGK